MVATSYSKHKLDDSVTEEETKAFFAKVKQLTSTKHKNVALRVWNGDVLSKNRLHHMGLAENNTCDFCGEEDTQIHVMRDCTKARGVQLILNTLKEAEVQSSKDWTGINDSLTELELRCECWWHMLNNRSLDANNLVNVSVLYLNKIHSYAKLGQGDVNVNILLN